MLFSTSECLRQLLSQGPGADGSMVCAFSEQPSGRLGHDAPAEDLDVLRGSKIPRWKRWNVSAKQPGVLQFIRRRRKKTQEFTLNLEVSHANQPEDCSGCGSHGRHTAMARWQSSQLSEITLFNGLELLAKTMVPRFAWASNSRVHEIAA